MKGLNSFSRSLRESTMPYWTKAVNHLIRCNTILTLFFLALLDRIQFATLTALSDFKGPLGIKSPILTAELDRTGLMIDKMKYKWKNFAKKMFHKSRLHTCFDNFLFSFHYVRIGILKRSLFIFSIRHVVDSLTLQILEIKTNPKSTNFVFKNDTHAENGKC